MAKGFGAGSPLLLANRYGRISDTFLDSLSPDEKILIDNHLLNRLIESENDAMKRAREDAKDRAEHPGMERYDSEDDFWAEAERAEREKHR